MPSPLSGDVYDASSNVDPSLPLYVQPLPARNGTMGCTYTEGQYVILQAVPANAYCPAILLRVSDDARSLTVVDHFLSYSDALTAMDYHNAIDARSAKV